MKWSPADEKCNDDDATLRAIGAAVVELVQCFGNKNRAFQRKDLRV